LPDSRERRPVRLFSSQLVGTLYRLDHQENARSTLAMKGIHARRQVRTLASLASVLLFIGAPRVRPKPLAPLIPNSSHCKIKWRHRIGPKKNRELEKRLNVLSQVRQIGSNTLIQFRPVDGFLEPARATARGRSSHLIIRENVSASGHALAEMGAIRATSNSRRCHLHKLP
jgi:hypothetical protein